MSLAVARAADDVDLRVQIQQLLEQNRALQEQAQRQAALLDALSRKVTSLEERNADRAAGKDAGAQEEMAAPRASAFSVLGKINISGEAGVGFFDTASKGQSPNSEFRVDEARLFVDAQAGEDVYAFLELNLATRESMDLDLRLGEAYIDFENLSRFWHHDRAVNLRLGRLDVPFGEEYLQRDAIDNPLISHSIMDFWGIDEGLELYGSIGKLSYVLAVQNGGISVTRDFNSDKSVALRVGGDPCRWLHLSVSLMRTGELDANADSASELWIGNGLFWSIGSTNTTRFHAELAQGDIEFRLPRGHVHLAGGYACYDDNDPLAQNRRDIWFYSAEAVHDVTRKLYAGARFSHMLVAGGYPIPGQGEWADYGSILTDELWRLSLGLGYRWNDNVVLKTEYSFQRGRTTAGEWRDQEDMVSAMAAFKF